MKLKKLKRLLSLTLSAAMMVSMVSVPVKAETVSDNPVPALEQGIDEKQGAKDGEGVSDAEAKGQDQAGRADDAVEGQTPSGEDTTGKPERLPGEEVTGGRLGDTGTEEEQTGNVENNGIRTIEEADGGTQDGESQPEQPAASAAIVVGDGAGQTPDLDAAVDAAAAGEVKTIELAKDVELTKNLDNVTINTKGHMITIPTTAEVAFGANTTIKNDQAKEADASLPGEQRNHLAILVEGTLTVKGGTYETKSVQLLKVKGIATVEDGTFACTAEEKDISSQDYYDGNTLIDVDGTGAKLTMTGGTVNADIGNTTNCGMYGIYVWNGGELKMGQTGTKGPTVNSMFAAIAMNYTTAPGRITVESGTYKSSVSCSDSNEEKFNAVVYLPASATVNISGGTFEAVPKNNSAKAHVISIPYDTVSGSSVRLNLNITGGTFLSKNDASVFYHPKKSEDNKRMKVTVSGGEYATDVSKELLASSIPEGLECYQPGGTGLYKIDAPAIATVDGKTYSNFQEAVDAAKEASDKTITLAKDMELEGSYDLTGVTVDTKGYRITVPEGKELTLTSGIVKNNELAVYANDAWEKSRQIFEVIGSLTINGGTYETKGVQMIRVNNGVANIGGGATLSCTATKDAISSIGDSYDGVALLNVTGTGSLTVKDATINANVGNGTDCGMYGIYVNLGGTLILGEGEAVPVIDSLFSPVAMNGLKSPGKITINGGSYTSHVACADSIKNFNAVLYLPANADVTINDGTFTAAGTTGEQHVISVPYSKVNEKNVQLNLVINGGTFKVTGGSETSAIFYDKKVAGDDLNLNIRGGVFNKEPTHVAGCNPAEKNSDGMWVVEGNAEHKIVWVAKKDSTCWEEGVIGHYECSECHKMYSSNTASDDKELRAEQVVILKKEHTGKMHAAVTASNPCTEPSNTAYAQCENCGLYYKDLEALEADEDGSKGSKDGHEYITPAEGHNYYKSVENDSEGDKEFAATFDVTGFTADNFQYGQANGVKVKLTCQNEGCGHEIEADEVSVNIASGELTGNCTVKKDLTLDVSAIFKQDEFEKPVTNANDFMRPAIKGTPCSVPAKQHTFDADSVTVNWDAFDVSSFQAGEANGVTATGICKVCKESVEATKVAVTSADYPATGASCQVKYNFAAKVTLGNAVGEGDAALSAPDVTVTKEFSGKHSLVEKDTYLGADCMRPGHWATYACTTCQKEFLGEDSAKNDQPVSAEDKIIPKRPHTINAPVFSWMKDAQGKETDKAQAVFTCTACKHSITVDNLTAAPKDESQKATCGTTTTLTYNVQVEFNKSAVGENEAKDGLTYTPDDPQFADGEKVTHKKELTKTETLQHVLEGADLAIEWADKDSVSNDIHDVSKGVKVVITCKREDCDKTLTVVSPGKIMDEGSNMLDDEGMEYIAPVVSLTRDKTAEGDKDATCQEQGNFVYKVKVTYRDEAGETKEIGEGSISTKTVKDDNAHTWSDVTWKWEPQQNEAGTGVDIITIDAVDAAGKTVKCLVPKYKVSAEYSCTNGCNTKKTAEKTLNEAPSETTAEPHLEIEAVHEKGSCVTTSKTTFTAKIYDGKELIATSEPEVYIKPANGHQITVDWDWEDDAKTEDAVPTRYTKVTATRYCTVCSRDENAESKLAEAVYEVEIPETGQIPTATDDRNLRTLVVTKDGAGATCDTPGTTTYIATLKEGGADGDPIAEDKRELSNKALGHDYKWFVEWTANEGKTGAEKYTVTRTKKCQRTGCGQAPEGGNNTVTVTPTYASKAATCSAEGSESWSIDTTLSEGEAYADEQLKENGSLKDELTKKEEVIAKDADAHNYGEAEVQWDEAAAATGASTITVTCTRKCSYAADNADHIPAETETLTAAKQDGAEITDCSKGYEWTYQVSDTELQKVQGWEFPSDWNNGILVHKVDAAAGAANHDLRYVRGTSSNSCTEKVVPNHYVCDRCGKFYKDRACSVEYTAEDVAGKVQGHLYGEPEFSWVAGKEGEEAQAVFTCMRSGCQESAVGHKKTLPVTVDKNTTAKGEEAQCEDTERGPLTVEAHLCANGEGYNWVLATLELTQEQIGDDNYVEGESYEGMLYQILEAVPHEFENGKCKWCPKEGGITVVFYGRDGSTVVGRTYLPKTLPDAKDIELATAVNQVGYTFVGWTTTKDGTAKSEDIQADILKAAQAITTDTGTINVYSVYEREEVKNAAIEIQFVLKNGTVETPVKEAVTAERAVGTSYTAQAEAELTADGQKVVFSHWERDGVTVGTEQEYQFHILTASKVTLKAVYVAEGSQVKAEPTIEITETYTSTVDGKNKISFASTMSIPEGYTVREAGTLYIKGTDINMLEENMKVNTIGTTVDGVALPHKKYVFSGSGNTKILTMQVTGLEDKKVYARPYVIVVNKEGNEETYHGKMKVTTYNEMNAQKTN